MVSMTGISVFAIFFFFFNGIAVLGSPQSPLPYS